jgi:NAD(P)-dependent dehydrogenase (short-subunit alcohol dehydrogenase family)
VSSRHAKIGLFNIGDCGPLSRVVITGGASSVGLALARRFVADGHEVWICDVDQAAVEGLSRSDPGLHAGVVDLLDPYQVEGFFARITAEAGGVDILVNTVGLGGPRAAIEDVTYDEWERTIRGSAGAAFFCIKQVVPHMKRQRFGVIVNFSSCSAQTVLPLRAPYVVAKGAVEALTLSLARELGPYNVRINAIRPGAIDNPRLTEIFARAAESEGVTAEAYEREALKFVSMRSKIGIDELVAAVLYLTSDQAPHVTGQILAVDGNVEWEA